MIDFIKFVIPTREYLGDFINEPDYNFNQRYMNNTDELKLPIWGQKDGMKVKITDKVIEVSGSIHKYWNLKQYNTHANYNDFNRTAIRDALELLAKEFRFNLKDSVISNLEFGVNIEPTSAPTDIIQKHILTYKEREPKINDDYKGSGKFTQFEFSNYCLKIYDKGKQFNLDYRLLRVEIKTKKSVHVTGIGNKWTLLKLTESATLEYLGDMLIETFNKLLMCDDFELVDIVDNSDYQKLLTFINPRTWVQWKSELTNKTKNRRKDVFRQLKEKYDLNTNQSELAALIQSKVETLRSQ